MDTVIEPNSPTSDDVGDLFVRTPVLRALRTFISLSPLAPKKDDGSQDRDNEDDKTQDKCVALEVVGMFLWAEARAEESAKILVVSGKLLSVASLLLEQCMKQENQDTHNLRLAQMLLGMLVNVCTHEDFREQAAGAEDLVDNLLSCILTCNNAEVLIQAFLLLNVVLRNSDSEVWRKAFVECPNLISRMVDMAACTLISELLTSVLDAATAMAEDSDTLAAYIKDSCLLEHTVIKLPKQYLRGVQGIDASSAGTTRDGSSDDEAGPCLVVSEEAVIAAWNLLQVMHDVDGGREALHKHYGRLQRDGAKILQNVDTPSVCRATLMSLVQLHSKEGLAYAIAQPGVLTRVADMMADVVDDTPLRDTVWYALRYAADVAKSTECVEIFEQRMDVLLWHADWSVSYCRAALKAVASMFHNWRISSARDAESPLKHVLEAMEFGIKDLLALSPEEANKEWQDRWARRVERAAQAKTPPANSSPETSNQHQNPKHPDGNGLPDVSRHAGNPAEPDRPPLPDNSERNEQAEDTRAVYPRQTSEPGKPDQSDDSKVT